MLNGCTFADVCRYLQGKGDPGFVDAADKLAGLAVISTAGHAALATAIEPVSAIGILGLLSARDEIIRTTKHLLNAIAAKNEHEDALMRYERMEKAYCLVCHTGFFDAIALSAPALLSQLDFSKNELSLLSEKASRVSSGDHAEPSSSQGATSPPSLPKVFLPHPSLDRVKEREVLKQFYNRFATGLLDFIKHLSLWEDASEQKQAHIRELFKALPGRALRNFDAQYIALCARFPDFYIFASVSSQANLRKQLAALDSTTRIQIDAIRAVKDELDVGFSRISSILDRLSADTTATKAEQALATLQRLYKARLSSPIISADRFA